MFSNLLYKSVQVGEKAFHILCDMNINLEELEKFGVEVIKIASDLKQKAQEAQAKQAEAPPVAAQPEQPKEEAKVPDAQA